MASHAVTNRTTPPLTRDTLSSLNRKTMQPLRKDTLSSLNKGAASQAGARPAARPSAPPAPPPRQTAAPRPAPAPTPAAAPRPTPAPAPVVSPPPAPAAPAVRPMVIPALRNPLRKGQKTSLGNVRRLNACFGWNVKDPRCDIDASAFLVEAGGRVPGDDWFVFYGQTQSPEKSVQFREDSSLGDREIIRIDLDLLHGSIQKIVLVLTINEAFAQNLNFSMIQEAYVRLLDGATGQELLSYRLEEYYETVTSMTIGELYLHNGQWKFNPVGNGVRQDLAGQCAIYGVEIC